MYSGVLVEQVGCVWGADAFWDRFNVPKRVGAEEDISTEIAVNGFQVGRNAFNEAPDAGFSIHERDHGALMPRAALVS